MNETRNTMEMLELLQSITENVIFLSIAFGAAGLLWLLGALYRYRGTVLLSQLSRDQIDQARGFGSWYAKNITGNPRSVLYSMAHYTLIPLTFLIAGFIFAPFEFDLVLERILPVFPFFVILGLVCGIDFRYRWWGTGKPEPMESATHENHEG